MEIALEVNWSKSRFFLIQCFNPCSIGNCSGRLANYGKGTRFEAFQSLFYWKLLWKVTGTAYSISAGNSFNPCSIGNCSGRRKTDKSRSVELAVSILVLLEIALEEGGSVERWQCPWVSILVLLEIALEALEL